MPGPSVIDFLSKNVIQSQTFSSSGSFTVPAGVTKLFLFGVGGGGGGGGSATVSGAGGGQNSGGGAGGSGTVPRLAPVTVSPGQVYSVTVGLGGSGGSAGGNGGDGSDTVFSGNGITYRFKGGIAGGGGGAASGGSSSPGGVGQSTLWTPSVQYTGGGNGGNGVIFGTATDGTTGAASNYGIAGIPGPAGTPDGDDPVGGGSGSGGAGLGSGGSGGVGKSDVDIETQGVFANPGSPGGLGAGGGGAGGIGYDGAGSAFGAFGGAGGNGILKVMWISF